MCVVCGNAINIKYIMSILILLFRFILEGQWNFSRYATDKIQCSRTIISFSSINPNKCFRSILIIMMRRPSACITHSLDPCSLWTFIDIYALCSSETHSVECKTDSFHLNYIVAHFKLICVSGRNDWMENALYFVCVCKYCWVMFIAQQINA